MTWSVLKSSVPGPESLVLALMIAVVPLGGCTATGTGSDMSYSAQSGPAPAFETASNRPPTAATLYAMAHILAAQGRDEECKFVLTRIVGEHPRFLPAYCELAELHLRHRRVEDAIDALSAGLDAAPQNPMLLNDLGMCRLLKGNYEKALSAFTEAASVAPQDARYRANMAVALGLMGRYQEAITIYEQVIPEADAHYNLSVLCRARGDSARARQEYGQAKALGLDLAESEQELPLPAIPPESP